MKQIDPNKKILTPIEKAYIALKQKTIIIPEKKQTLKEYSIKISVIKTIKAKNLQKAKEKTKKEIKNKTILNKIDIGSYNIKELTYRASH